MYGSLDVRFDDLTIKGKALQGSQSHYATIDLGELAIVLTPTQLREVVEAGIDVLSEIDAESRAVTDLPEEGKAA